MTGQSFDLTEPPRNGTFAVQDMPYMKRRPVPTTYHEAIAYSVTSYKKMRTMLDWFFDIADYQPSGIPRPLNDDITGLDDDNLAKKRALYQWALDDGFPAHLKTVPNRQDPTQIFDFKRLYDTLQAVYPSLPDVDFFQDLAPPTDSTMASLEFRNQIIHYTSLGLRAPNMYAEDNVGLREDWYTDAVFAQQQFTGVNPLSLELATQAWIDAFTKVATDQGNDAAIHLLSNSPTTSFYIQDNSGVRAITGMDPGKDIVSSTGDDSGNLPRYGCASVALFYLPDDGKLHPIAIIIDYKGSVDASTSVIIFKSRLTAQDSSVDEKTNWPWRYAKMCTQVSDWTRHELPVHLVHTHFVEEALIVSAQRNLPDSHIIFALLSPHWKTTLSVNALAREVLIPQMLNPITAFEMPEIKSVCLNSYSTFDFVGSYVPNELKKRGFPIDQLDDQKFHNYAYARDVSKLWDALRKFVASILQAYYKNGDSDVVADKYLAGFCAEMQSDQGGQMHLFPTVSTLDGLIDMVTMCIHITAPQHTAVNYLQQYYLTFVPNRPSALFAPLPKSLPELQKYQEADILAALPLKVQKDWLLMAQVPYLLSAEVDPENNIITYAEMAAASGDQVIARAGKALRDDLSILAKVFKAYSDQMDDQVAKYMVLDPVDLASSIVI